eukprot:2925210-Pyramimonas_sp.AAC.1
MSLGSSRPHAANAALVTESFYGNTKFSNLFFCRTQARLSARAVVLRAATVRASAHRVAARSAFGR